MKLDVSTGLDGSWYFSCATSSWRNACGSSRELPPALAVPEDEVAPVVPVVPVAAAVFGVANALAPIASIGLVMVRSHPSVEAVVGGPARAMARPVVLVRVVTVLGAGPAGVLLAALLG